ncbi:MAG: 4-(cytidine 5'-diphospho)-2-C-methyl-D-erythritol kinase [Paludibacteraceae bacterium]
MIVFPNAKINLGLNVVGCRPDGYHDIETVFYPINVCDALEVVPAADTSFEVVGQPIAGSTESNLVMRAYRLLQRDFRLPDVQITLLKKIPMGAGLGGGSSDAAFMLKLLNTQFALGVSDERLEAYAATLGADCAFFVRNVPAFAEGIGDRLTPLSLSLSSWKILLLKPAVHVSTAEAYAEVPCRRWTHPLADVIQRPVNEWNGLLFNDFERSVFARHPELALIKQRLYECGAVYASMSGSGSTIYGLFAPDFDEAAFARLTFPEQTLRLVVK